MQFQIIPLTITLLLSISPISSSQNNTNNLLLATVGDERKTTLEEEKFEFEQWKHWTEIVVVITGVFLSLNTYVTTQKWKRREYLDNKFKEFENSREVINVRKMLDSDSHFVNLFPDDPMPPNRFNYITDEDWANALIELNKQSIDKAVKDLEDFYEGYVDKTKKEVKGVHYPRHVDEPLRSLAIRDDFNRFLDYLQQFKSMLDSNTVNKDDLEKYLRNWALIIEEVEEKYKKVLLKYMMGAPSTPATSTQTPTQKSVKELFETFYTVPPDSKNEFWTGIKVNAISKDRLGKWPKEWWTAEGVSKWLKKWWKDKMEWWTATD